MRSTKAFVLLLAGLCFAPSVWPQSPNQIREFSSLRAVDRVLLPVADQRRVALLGQRHPLAKPLYSIGRMAPDLYLQQMVLVLAPDAAQQAALEEMLRAQHDPESPYYQRWLTPEQFGQRFGISLNDLNQVKVWLENHGMQVEEIPASRRAIIFSGSSAQVESTFHTRMQHYLVEGAMHYANASDPEIPQALAGVISGVVSLHDFRSAPAHVAVPQFTAANGAHFLMPQDWATIYNVSPLYNQGLDGTGQSIAVLGRVGISMQDVRTFRKNAGLAPNDPQMIVNGADPGSTWCDDELESAMDVEWAGAIARNATIKFVTTKSGATDGINLSAQYAVNHNVAPIITLSYGLCESDLGAAGNAFWNSTWAQAAAQGISVFVSSGDSGAAGCDSPVLKKATQTRGVNGLCSTPYSTCVGGTQFNDAYNSAQYWSSSNGSGQSSAITYIPEQVWNESAWSGGLWAGGGGASSLYGKPGWQVAPGVIADARRDVPDVALHASIQDAYVVQVQGNIFYASGTSAAAPSLASVMALVNEQRGKAQGNANPFFYRLANLQLSAGGAPVFHDITSGNNSVPGIAGFNSGAGYDAATGLGSVDASVLVNHWGDSAVANFTLTPNVSRLSTYRGGSAAATLTMTTQGGFSAAATLSSAWVPPGVTVSFSAPAVTAARTASVTFAASANAATGTFPITISGTGGGLTRNATVTVTVPAPSFTLTSGVGSATVNAGSSATMLVTVVPSNGFKSAVALSATGLPAGVSAAYVPASVVAPGSSTLKLTAASGVAGGVFTLTLRGTGAGITASKAVSLTVASPSFALSLTATKAGLRRGGSIPLKVSTSGTGGFKSAVALSVRGLPKGVSATFVPARIASPGTGSSTLALKAVRTAMIGTTVLTVTGTSEKITKSQTLILTVK